MFEATETRMAAFEHLEGQRLPPEMHTVVRLEAIAVDGLLADEALGFSGPLDTRLAKTFLKTASYVLRSHSDGLYAFVAGTSFDILLDLDSFRERRDPRQLLSDFSGEAAAKASLLLDQPARFDCRLYCFPSGDQAIDYFAWRQRLCRASAVAHVCESVLVGNGAEPSAARKILDSMANEEQEEVLANNDVDVGDLAGWVRTGTGLYWAEPGSIGEGATLLLNPELPDGEAYRIFVERFLE